MGWPLLANPVGAWTYGMLVPLVSPVPPLTLLLTSLTPCLTALLQPSGSLRGPLCPLNPSELPYALPLLPYPLRYAPSWAALFSPCHLVTWAAKVPSREAGCGGGGSDL